MLLGGFLKQMNDTIKYNRDLRGKSKRKPFDKSERKPITYNPTDDISSISEAELESG